MAIKNNRIYNCNFYMDGDGFMGQIEEVNMPEIKFKKGEFKSLGLMALTEFTAGIDKMEFKVKMNSFYPDLLAKLADPFTTKAIQIRGSLQQWEATTLSGEKPVVCYMRVQSQSFPGAAFKQLDPVEMEGNFTVLYYKLEIDGRVIMEIDALANIFIADGKDLLAGYRANVGG